MEQVILVNEQDEPIGVSEKLEAHQQGKLHRAFSIFVLRKKQDKLETLLQQRQFNKYHSRGLWTNTCCSHPRPDEPTIQAGQRRLMEEMGIQCNLKEIGSFIYQASLENDLVENEFDHVLVGSFDDAFTVNPDEAADHRWINFNDLEKELAEKPGTFTAWFAQAFEIVKNQ